MSEVIGDTSALHTDVSPFKVVVTAVGPSGSGHFTLEERLASRIAPHGLAEILGSVTCTVACPPAADKAAVLRIAVIPSSCSTQPQTAAEVAGVPGSVIVRDSLYSAARPVALNFGPEVSHVIKPTQLVGFSPRFVYHYHVEGAEASTETLIELSGSLRLQGVGFVKTW